MHINMGQVCGFVWQKSWPDRTYYCFPRGVSVVNLEELVYKGNIVVKKQRGHQSSRFGKGLIRLNGNLSALDLQTESCWSDILAGHMDGPHEWPLIEQ